MVTLPWPVDKGSGEILVAWLSSHIVVFLSRIFTGWFTYGANDFAKLLVFYVDQLFC